MSGQRLFLPTLFTVFSLVGVNWCPTIVILFPLFLLHCGFGSHFPQTLSFQNHLKLYHQSRDGNCDGVLTKRWNRDTGVTAVPRGRRRLGGQGHKLRSTWSCQYLGEERGIPAAAFGGASTSIRTSELQNRQSMDCCWLSHQEFSNYYGGHRKSPRELLKVS